MKEYCYYILYIIYYIYITKIKIYAIFVCLHVNIIHLKHAHNFSKAFIADLSMYYKFYRNL